ncbi:hypothetical protein L7F22_044608 [Adiantum nelumboides]|nr:hypothetical protein [Adiantum nelumboides]
MDASAGRSKAVADAVQSYCKSPWSIKLCLGKEEDEELGNGTPTLEGLKARLAAFEHRVASSLKQMESEMGVAKQQVVALSTDKQAIDAAAGDLVKQGPVVSSRGSAQVMG